MQVVDVWDLCFLHSEYEFFPSDSLINFRAGASAPVTLAIHGQIQPKFSTLYPAYFSDTNIVVAGRYGAWCGRLASFTAWFMERGHTCTLMFYAEEKPNQKGDIG